MYGFGDAAMAGVRGWRAAEQDRAADQEREYRQNKRIEDDAYTRQQRARNGVLQERQDTQWDQQQSEYKRQQAIREGATALMRGRMTGDYSGLTRFMQTYDNQDDANVTAVTTGSKPGFLKIQFDDGNAHEVDEGRMKQLMMFQMSPDNWLKLQGERELIGVRTEAEKDLIGARAESEKGLIGVRAESQMDIDDNASGNRKTEKRHASQFDNPEVKTHYDDQGRLVQRYYQGGEMTDEIVGYDPQTLKAIADGGSGVAKDELDMNKFFAQLSAKQFGVPDANGNIMLDAENGAMKSKVEALASQMYREFGKKYTPLQHFAMALKITRDNPVMSEKDAMKALKEQGKDEPGFWSNSAERERYMREVRELVDQSRQIPTSIGPPGVQTRGIPAQPNGVQAVPGPQSSPAPQQQPGVQAPVVNPAAPPAPAANVSPDEILEGLKQRLGADFNRDLAIQKLQERFPGWTPKAVDPVSQGMGGIPNAAGIAAGGVTGEPSPQSQPQVMQQGVDPLTAGLNRTISDLRAEIDTLTKQRDAASGRTKAGFTQRINKIQGKIDSLSKLLD